MLDLEPVPGVVLPGDAVADVRRGACLELPEPGGALWIGGAGHDEARDQLGLVVGDHPHAAFSRLEKSDHEEIVELAVESMDEQLGAALGVEDEALIHEREAWPKAGGIDDEVDLLVAAVDKMHSLAVETLDGRLGQDAPMDDVIEIKGAGGGMRFEQLVIRSRHVVAPMRADHDAQAPPVELAHHRARQRPAAGEIDEGVGRLAHHDLGEEVVTSPHRVHGAPTVVGRVIEDINSRVAGADHEHALALELLLRLHVMRMQGLAVEGARIAGPARLPVMAVGDDETIVEARLCFALDLNAPASLDTVGRHDPGIEGYAVVKLERARIGAEILLRLRAAHVMRPFLREGEIRIARQLLRRVEKGRTVDRVRACRVPDAADIGERLEAVEWDSAFGEGLGHSKSAGAGADDAIPLHHFSAQNDAPSSVRSGRTAVDNMDGGRRPSQSRPRLGGSLTCIKSVVWRKLVYKAKAPVYGPLSSLHFAGLCIVVSRR